MSYLDRIRACQVFDAGAYLPFCVDTVAVGHVRPALADRLRAFGDVFEVAADAVHLAPALTTVEARTRAVESVLRRLADDGVMTRWRDEPYPVTTAYGAPVLFTIERAAVPLFGIRACGVHVNGIVRDSDASGGLHMWIGRRSLDKPVAPGKFDQIVAGGQPAGLGVRENLLKEADEEASIPAVLAATAQPVGAITYRTECSTGLRNDVLFVFDLALPPTFEPKNQDGEIADFALWPIDEVAARVRDSDDFKFNCSLVIIDFLIRHGDIGPEEPDYLDLCQGLRSG